jgi:hypothetical protein
LKQGRPLAFFAHPVAVAENCTGETGEREGNVNHFPPRRPTLHQRFITMPDYPSSDESFARLHQAGWSIGELGGTHDDVSIREDVVR